MTLAIFKVEWLMRLQSMITTMLLAKFKLFSVILAEVHQQQQDLSPSVSVRPRQIHQQAPSWHMAMTNDRGSKLPHKLVSRVHAIPWDHQRWRSRGPLGWDTSRQRGSFWNKLTEMGRTSYMSESWPLLIACRRNKLRNETVVHPSLFEGQKVTPPEY